MTDLVHHTDQGDAVLPATPFGGAASELIRQTAGALSDAHKIASALVQTAFAPAHFRGKPEEGAAAILYGATINMDPLTALQNLYVIGGKPALYARAMVAVVMSHGHRIWTEDETEGSVTVAGQRKGTETVERVTWTTDMAKRAGYANNKKYQTDPRSMLYARASGDVARRIAPDALLGMAHNVEELTIDPTAGGDDPAPAQRRVTAAEFTTTTQQPPAAHDPVEPDKWEPVTEPPAPAGPPPEPTPRPADDEPEPITAPQLKAIATLAGKLGLTRDQKLAGLAHYAGRPIDTSKALTKIEATWCIDAMKAKVDELPVEEPPADDTGAWEQTGPNLLDAAEQGDGQ